MGDAARGGLRQGRSGVRTGSGIACLGLWLWVAACALAPSIGTESYKAAVMTAIAITAMLFVRDLFGRPR